MTAPPVAAAESERLAAPDARRRIGVGAILVIVLLAFAAVVVIGMLRGTTGTQIVAASPTPSAAVLAPATAGVYVHVAGAVRAVGLYRLDVGGRVADAIALAGGFADDADRAGVNLARPVTDGEQIVVPVLGAIPDAVAPGAAANGAAGGLIDLNAATADQLDTLPRVGPAMAERIISWREQNGRFTSVDDLLSVPGIGDKMLAAIRDLVRV
ncbi:ComEA family DNA-binding protein [uncultured Microbacterium sp.]|uniref:ComEA family DNA-binding protein n=1 Tax=uncultured Microbacterium sp. TaxID=191216 RepID=UPI0025F32BA2|nr:ComEA family DNA-binding protein [uncultured Microbacterium sp.]